MFYFNSNQISIVKENIYSIFFASVNIFFNYSFLASFHFGHLGFLTKNSQNLVRNKIVFYDVHEHESVLVKKKKEYMSSNAIAISMEYETEISYQVY